VKLDVEGFEYELLPHLGPLLGPRTEAALIALHPKILLATGRGRADIEAATARALAPLAGFRSTILDGTALTGANVTVLFERE
jgi:hypothetical protein